MVEKNYIYMNLKIQKNSTMKFRSSILAAVAIGLMFLGAFYPKPDDKAKEQMILYAVMSLIDQLHFNPKNLNDEFSEKAFDIYLNYIDGGKRFLTQGDIALLTPYKSDIDDMVKAQNFEFFDLSVELVNNSLLRSEKIYNEIIKKPFDFSSKEYLELDSEKRTFAKDETELKEYWRKTLKYETLVKVNSKIKKLKEDGEAVTIKQLEIEAREDVKELFDDVFQNLGKLRRSDRFEAYVSSITHIFDPHSDYFNPKEKEDFDIRMGGVLEGIGARLQTDGDYTKVVSIIPGGPAWKGKELEIDDVITKVSQKNSENAIHDVVDIFGMRIDDVVQLIRGKKGTRVVLDVTKQSGELSEIEIERDEVIIDEGNARSVIIDLDGKVNNIGYIQLPSFYADFERKDGRSSSEHVAQEVQKLKESNVNGIILDLRNNGGGSLRDVVQMSGLFIEDGPIVQVKPRDRSAYVYEDEDDAVRYDGPLIVMVNNFSASASEILAAALQDYGRAVIVGSNSTFGKGTVQRFFDLDRAVRGNSDIKPLGQVKLTTQKFYRVNGGSTQLKGVVPDIILPDNFYYITMGEKQYEYPMEWTEIEPVSFNQDVYRIHNMNTIIELSKQRVENNPTFTRILENAKRLKKNQDNTVTPLDLQTFSNDLQDREDEAKKYRDLMKEEIIAYNIENVKVDIEKINMDESSVARNEDFMKALKKDIYLEETLNIIGDMLVKN
jgi:carboxyl-terminal processing protease